MPVSATLTSKPTVFARQRNAQRLAARLAAHPRFECLCQHCGRERDAGIDEVPEWRIWNDRPTTPDQLLIEGALENLVTASTRILHIGVGNSGLGRRFAPRVSTVVGTTLHDEERVFSEGLGIQNYAVVRANKYSSAQMDQIGGRFDFIVDNNPASFACCLFHFACMMIRYAELLRNDGGLLLTAQGGLRWVVPGNDPNWSLGWDDWALLGGILGMPVARVMDSVCSMQRLPPGE